MFFFSRNNLFSILLCVNQNITFFILKIIYLKLNLFQNNESDKEVDMRRQDL